MPQKGQRKSCWAEPFETAMPQHSPFRYAPEELLLLWGLCPFRIALFGFAPFAEPFCGIAASKTAMLGLCPFKGLRPSAPQQPQQLFWGVALFQSLFPQRSSYFKDVYSTRLLLWMKPARGFISKKLK